MALSLVLCGGNDRISEDLASSWCKKHLGCTVLQLLALNVSELMKLSKKELQCHKENRPFISIGGLDFLFSHNGTMCAGAAADYIEGTKKSLVLAICPGDINTRNKENLFRQLNVYNLPFVVATCTATDTTSLIEIVENASKGKFLNHFSLNSCSNALNLPFLAHDTDRSHGIKLRSLALSDSHIDQSFTLMPNGKENRMLNRYGAENFLAVTFNFKMKPKDIISVLSKGISLDGEGFQFIGCSSSGLKKRSCYMMKGTVNDVERVRDTECGQFSKITSVPKRLKGISLLFSNATPTGIDIENDCVKIIEDVTSEDGQYNFTDGCGAVGSELHREIIEGARLTDFLPDGYTPSVLQIRLKGYKGVVTLDPKLKTDTIFVRRSMVKFESGTRPFSQVWLCNYSKPYSIGYLNKQYIILLSGLGVPDEVLLKKQQNYYDRMLSLKQDPQVSFDQLCISGQHALAAQVAIGNHAGKDVQEALSRIQRKFLEKISKLSIQIQDSRNVFGICDTSGVLDYGECFFRPTINGEPRTVSGKVIVAKNPCYFLGDVRVLVAVDGSRTKHLSHLVDCIIFPTRGARPHPDEITGSDLDGDEYFVCWDEELSIGRLQNPTDFSALAKASMSSHHHVWKSCIEYLANQVNMMGILNSYFLYWAESKGVQSTECQQVGQLFSRSVDASKTGDRFVIPKHLCPPRERDGVKSTGVWKLMEIAAVEFSHSFTDLVIQNSVADGTAGFSEDTILTILQCKARKIPEFDLLNLLKKWCYSQSFTDEECSEKLIEFSKHIKFGKLTLKQKLVALELGVPVEIVTNALNSTKLLTAKMMEKFSLHDPHNRWCFFFQTTAAEFNWEDLLNAVTVYPESLLICRLQNDVIFALHFLTTLKTGEYELKAGSIISYFFSPRLELLQRHVLGSSFSIDLNADFMQLYRNGVRQNTFVWIKRVIISQTAQFEFDRISIDLTTFQKDIFSKYNHPKVNKQQLDAFEVYVKSYTEEPTYYDRLLSDLACDVSADPLEEDEEELEELPRESVKEKQLDLPVKASLIECLHFYARHGRIDKFSDALQSVLVREISREESLSKELSDAVCLLLTAVAQKSMHFHISAADSSALLSIITSLQFAISPAKICLFLLNKVSLLHSTELTRQVEDVILSCVLLCSTSEYMEVLAHWEWWCFLPQSVASSLSSELYARSLSLVPEIANSTLPTSIEGLTTSVQNPPMELKGMLEKYVHYYSHLFHLSFMDEFHSLQSNEKADRSAITKLKICDPANPHQQHNTEGQWNDEGGVSETVSQRTVEFHRSKGVYSRVEGYVIISFMSSDAESGFVPVACGLIMEVSRQPTNIVVKISEPIPQCIEISIRSGVGHWQLNGVGNVTSYVRGMKAISLLAKNGPAATSLVSILVNTEGGLSEDNQITSKTDKHQSAKIEFESFEHMNLPEPFPQNPILTSREVLTLNKKQDEAVMSSLKQRVTLIHGPPGTGKTRIACEIVCRRLHLNKDDMQTKVLVAAETNTAVDNLARQLMLQGVNVVRVGKREQIAEDVYSRISLESLVARSSETVRKSYMDGKIAARILRESDVVATTCSGAGDSILRSFSFPFVIIDEATLVKEPISLIPITKQCRQLTLIGDPEQLSPLSRIQRQAGDLEHDGLVVTMFHRLRRSIPSVLLEEQYRMSPMLVRFPSSEFYGGKLVCSPNVEKRQPDFILKSEKAINFIDVLSSKEEHEGTSFKNSVEADVVVNVVDFLIDCNVSPYEITVLTPYKKQVQCLIEKLSKRVNKVEVSTIDNFQGKENEVIIFSTVRSNVQGDLDFIAKRNRVNVLLTRAKHCLIGVGDLKTLHKISLWKDWLQQATVFPTDGQYLAKLCVHNPKNAKQKSSQPGDGRYSRSHDHSRASSSGPSSQPSQKQGSYYSQHHSDSTHHKYGGHTSSRSQHHHEFRGSGPRHQAQGYCGLRDQEQGRHEPRAQIQGHRGPRHQAQGHEPREQDQVWSRRGPSHHGPRARDQAQGYHGPRDQAQGHRYGHRDHA